jgi:hypothetical protein
MNKMANLLQAVTFNDEASVITKKENEKLKEFKSMTDLYKQTVFFIGPMLELKAKLDAKMKKDFKQIRNDRWIKNRVLPSKLQKVYTCNGEVPDAVTALNALPKVNISQYRNLADRFNMVIIPIQYTQIDKLFDTQPDSSRLKNGLKYFDELLRQDTTTTYQEYLLCPIDYYNVWEQIKSDTVKNIYYAPYFENIFATLDLLIPSQKNLYLATKTNDENLKTLAASFDANIKTLNDKITAVSNKVNKLEIDFIKEKQKNAEVQAQLQAQNQELRSTVLQQQQEIQFLYRNIDPILFAVPEDTDITTDDTTSIVGLCWGADIADMIFEMKGIKIEHEDLNKINPIYTLLNISGKVGLQLDFNKVIDYKEHIMKIIKDNIANLNSRISNRNWGYYEDGENYTLKIDNKYTLVFNYDNHEPRRIAYINVQDEDGIGLLNVDTDTYCRYNKNDITYKDVENNEKFFNVYKESFETIASNFASKYNED